jgi:hypothetical protein
LVLNFLSDEILSVELYNPIIRGRYLCKSLLGTISPFSTLMFLKTIVLDKIQPLSSNAYEQFATPTVCHGTDLGIRPWHQKALGVDFPIYALFNFASPRILTKVFP